MGDQKEDEQSSPMNESTSTDSDINTVNKMLLDNINQTTKKTPHELSAALPDKMPTNNSKAIQALRKRRG